MPRSAEAGGRGLSRGELARRTGCNIETIRYYERIGLLPPPPRTAGGHRVYGRALLKRLNFIRRSRELGFRLEEIRGLLALVDRGDYTCAEVREITAEHLERVRARIADLAKIEAALSDMVAQCEGDVVPECPVVDVLFGEGEEAGPP